MFSRTHSYVPSYWLAQAWRMLCSLPCAVEQLYAMDAAIAIADYLGGKAQPFRSSGTALICRES